MADLTQIGHYLIQSLLRQGRSADSYLAENAAIRSQKVLLRVLHPDTSKDPDLVREFMDEVRTAAKLDHNCIASVLDLKDDGERIYAVLEFIDGVDLEDLVARHGPPPPEVAVAIMHEVCSALEHAHGKSVLHRHLRPRHIKLTPEGGLKVLGFGLREQGNMLQSVVMPDAMRDEFYRPPEQVREQPEDARGDLYMLGVIIYELLTLRLPFESFVGPVVPGPGRKPAPVHTLNPLVPTSLSRLIERLLAERKEDRFPDAAAVRRSLDDLLDAYRVMHSTDVLRGYLGNPLGYGEKARPTAFASLLRDAEVLSKGSEADRRAALEELERLLAEDPRNSAAQSLVRRLRPSASDPGPTPAAHAAPVPYDAEKTVVMMPGEAVPLRQPQPPRPAPVPSAAPPPLAPVSAAMDRTLPPQPLPPPPPPAPMPRPPAPPRKPSPGPDMRMLLIGGAAVIVVLAIAITWLVVKPGSSSESAAAPDTTVAIGAAVTFTLAIETDPPGAMVLLPSTGQTHPSPASFPGVPTGDTRVRVMLPGYQTYDTTFAQPDVGEYALRLTLVKAMAQTCTLFVAVHPRADQVLIDGLAATPLDSSSWYMPVGAGTHSVEVTSAGYEKWNRIKGARVTAGANARLAISLMPESPGSSEPEPVSATATTTPGDKPWLVSGGIKVTVESVPEATLYVDGVAYPTLVKNTDLSMAPGEHRFRFVHPEFVEAVKTKKLKSGQKGTRIRQDFTVGSGILSIYAKPGAKVFVRGKFVGYQNLVVRDVEPGRCIIEMRDKDGVKVLATKEVMVQNSSVPVEVRF